MFCNANKILSHIALDLAFTIVEVFFSTFVFDFKLNNLVLVTC